MSSKDGTIHNFVQQNRHEETNGVYPSLTNGSTLNGDYSTAPGKPYPYFVPSTVKSTLGSPVGLMILIYNGILS